MENVQTSKKSLFLERWSNAEIINARLGLILMVMGSITLSLMATLIYVVIKPRPVYYVPGASSAGVAYAQSTTLTTVSMFTVAWVLNWSNFTPANVESVYKHAQQFMSPYLLARTKARLKKDLEQIKNNNISSLFSLSQEAVVVRDKEGFNVTVWGDKGVYMGKEEIKLQKMVYHIHVRQSPATDWDPYGLIIEDIAQEVNG